MINIVIPTYKRSKSLAGKEYFKTAKYVLPESQKDAYRKVLPSKRMIVIPDECDGNIARKRNWILDNIGRPLLMIDDDVKGLRMTEGMQESNRSRFKEKGIERIRLEPEQAMGVITGGFNMAAEFGCVLWGINLNEDGRNYQQYKPITLTEVILGPFGAHLDHDLHYDERMGTKDDYDFSIQVLNRYRKILRLNKFSYDCGHGDNEGGIVSMRTMEREINYCEAVMKKWGKHIIKYKIPPRKMTDLLNGRVNIPIQGV